MKATNMLFDTSLKTGKDIGGAIGSVIGGIGGYSYSPTFGYVGAKIGYSTGTVVGNKLGNMAKESGGKYGEYFGGIIGGFAGGAAGIAATATIKALNRYGKVDHRDAEYICKSHVTTKTVLKANNTLFDNLAYKFNLKARGVNWELGSDPALVTKLQNRDLLKSLMQNTLFFGIDLSHPLGKADSNLKPEHVAPSCVGFASNLYKGQANMSKGDFGYQAPQKTIVDAALLEGKFDAAINAYYRNSGRYPSWIVVYRSGLSEAEVQKVQDEEVPVLKATIDKLKTSSTEFSSASVKLTVIMANTKTNFRLFKDEIDTRDKAPMQNVPSGTCVSEKIVSRRVPSFILVAQRATARPAVYHVLEGADAYPLDQIQYVTYCLCFSHGIVGSPTKLPGPLVSAADLSKRARNNFHQHKLNGNDDTGSVTSDDSARYRQSQGDILTEEEKTQLDSKEEAHYDELNNILKAAIEEGRFWA